VVCGAVLDSGLKCLDPPLQGRKRCAVHKGMRTFKTDTKVATAVLAEDSFQPGHSTLTNQRRSPYAQQIFR
jgi:hypothetical protein